MSLQVKMFTATLAEDLEEAINDFVSKLEKDSSQLNDIQIDSCPRGDEVVYVGSISYWAEETEEIPATLDDFEQKGPDDYDRGFIAGVNSVLNGNEKH
jgi:hypothetical protein